MKIWGGKEYESQLQEHPAIFGVGFSNKGTTGRIPNYKFIRE
jgi:hypothetical protein